MDISERIEGAHTTPSLCGDHIASIASGKLRIHATHAPDRYSEFSFRIIPKDITVVKWSSESSLIVLLSPQNIEVLDLRDPSHRMRLDNGSGGLGRFVSVDFVGEDHILVIWEFGKTTLWNLRTGKGLDASDVKGRAGGLKWQIRPTRDGEAHDVIALLSRVAGEDVLALQFPSSALSMASRKLHTVDAQALDWSRDGKWLAIVDTPHASPAVHIHTADGSFFRAYDCKSTSPTGDIDTGVKEAVWSPNSRILAVAKHDGTLPLLSTTTFSPLAVVEHSTTIDQTSCTREAQASIWEEVVSAANIRTYRRANQPFSPPLSHAVKPGEHAAKGVAEARFNSDGSILATRDERMLNTVWLWNMDTLAIHSVLIQHRNVRRIQWHPGRVSEMMVDCGEGIAYLYDTSTAEPPTVAVVPLATSSLSWIRTSSHVRPAILATTMSAFHILFPEGRDFSVLASIHSKTASLTRADVPSPDADSEEGASEDSLFEMLSGRKPQEQGHDREVSYTERIEMETEEEDLTTRLDDTFREKNQPQSLVEELENDPLDDSQIF